jgi:diguanylate cyclase (GGDEF)-like protein
MRTAARHGMVIVIAAALLNILLLIATDPTTAPLAVGLNVGLAAVAGTAYAVMLRIGRHRPEAIVLLVLLAVDGATLLLGVELADFALLATGYFLLLPMVAALIIPWSTSFLLAFLGLHAAIVTVWDASLRQTSLLGADRYDLLALLAVATGVSLFGHLTSLRARVTSFVQIQRISALNRQARRDQDRLDRLNQLLAQSATTDELTGLRNRLGLAYDLRTVRSRIERQAERYGLLMLDLDRFKAINDTRGHVVGDGVLRTIAEAVSRVLRPGDTAYRYGGEEFAILVRLGKPGEGAVAGERIRAAVEGLGIGHPGNPPHGVVTVSVGVVAVGRADLRADDDAWVSRADAALYRAKAGGRNRCEVSR